MSLPVVNTALAQRLVQAEGAHMVSQLSALQRHHGADANLHIRRYGAAVALLCPTIPNPMLNRVLGFGPADVERLDELLAWYEQHQVVCRLEIVPYFSSPLFLAALTARGLSPCGYYTTLYGQPSAIVPPLASPMVTRLVERDSLEEWTRIFTEVYQLGDDIQAAVQASVQVQYAQPEWRCYVAEVDDEAVAIGALYVQDGVGMLISGATKPDFRRHGCQTALLHRRLADAVELGCDLVASYTEVGSTSQHNMERAGLRIAYTKTEWKARCEKYPLI